VPTSAIPAARRRTAPKFGFAGPLQALKNLAYLGWLSVEVFMFSRAAGGEHIARASEQGFGSVIYDNQMGKDDLGDDATELGGGSIVIHK
jgi:hypothetical protein